MSQLIDATQQNVVKYRGFINKTYLKYPIYAEWLL